MPWATASVALLALAGCGQGSGLRMYPIRGEVSYNGKPVTTGSVIYIPSGSAGKQAAGKIQPDGTFQLTTRQGNDGAVEGAYQIVVYSLKGQEQGPASRDETETGKARRPAKPAYMIPEKYARPETSGLTDNVDSKHPGFKKIELKD